MSVKILSHPGHFQTITGPCVITSNYHSKFTAVDIWGDDYLSVWSWLHECFAHLTCAVSSYWYQPAKRVTQSGGLILCDFRRALWSWSVKKLDFVLSLFLQGMWHRDYIQIFIIFLTKRKLTSLNRPLSTNDIIKIFVEKINGVVSRDESVKLHTVQTLANPVTHQLKLSAAVIGTLDALVSPQSTDGRQVVLKNFRLHHAMTMSHRGSGVKCHHGVSMLLIGWDAPWDV